MSGFKEKKYITFKEDYPEEIIDLFKFIVPYPGLYVNNINIINKETFEPDYTMEDWTIKKSSLRDTFFEDEINALQNGNRTLLYELLKINAKKDNQPFIERIKKYIFVLEENTVSFIKRQAYRAYILIKRGLFKPSECLKTDKQIKPYDKHDDLYEINPYYVKPSIPKQKDENRFLRPIINIINVCRRTRPSQSKKED